MSSPEREAETRLALTKHRILTTLINYGHEMPLIELAHILGLKREPRALTHIALVELVANRTLTITPNLTVHDTHRQEEALL